MVPELVYLLDPNDEFGRRSANLVFIERTEETESYRINNVVRC
jgi:hypothetical protein